MLTQLSEKSSELKGFFETKGYPEYLEVNKEILGTLTLKLIYPTESYSVEIVGNTAIINSITTEERKKEGFRSPPLPKINSPKSENAELTPRGDLVHYVISPNETIEQIAGWYTDNPANADKLLRLNSLNKKLEIGDVVVIPSYMVKKKSRMP